MSIYISIYNNLCSSRKLLAEQYFKGSGLHRHHIVPVHQGGLNDDSNYTYLTVREHIIAHFLLWKIHKNPNDLRAMRMLGAHLSVEQRRIIGNWCKNKRLGIHNPKYSKEEKLEWKSKGRQTQKQAGDTNSWYYWSTAEGRKKRASMGGKASFQSGNNPAFLFWHTPEGQKIRASMGGKSHKGKIAVTNGKHRTRIKPELLDEYVAKGYRRGFTLFSDT